MQEVGIGGTLSFDSSPALHGMQEAAHGFEHLDHAREHFQHNLHGLSESLEHFNLISAGLGIAGIAGLHQLIHSSMEIASEQEQAQISMGTTLGIARGVGFQKGFGLAKQEIEKLQDIGIETGATFSGLIGIYKQIAMPLSQAGASLTTIRDMTKQTSIMASATGASFEEMGSNITRFLGGFVRDRDPLFRQLKMSGLVRKDMAAEEIQAMTPTERMKLVSTVLKRYGEGAEVVTTSWKAVWQSVANVVEKVKESFAGMDTGLFAKLKEDALGIRKFWEEHGKQVIEIAEEMGQKLVPIYEVMKEAVKALVGHAINFARHVEDWVENITTFVESLGVSNESMHGIAVSAAEFAMVFGTLIPLLGIMKMVLGPGLASLSLLGSGFKYLLALFKTVEEEEAVVAVAGASAFWPIVLAAAALGLVFMALRKDGESFGETIQRLYNDYIKPFVDGFVEAFSAAWPDIMAPLEEAWAAIKEAFSFLTVYLADTFGGGQDSAKSFGSTVGNVVASIILELTRIIGFFGRVLAAGIKTIAYIIYGFKELGKYIGEGMGMAVLAVENVFKALVNVMTAPFRFILEMVSSIITKLASTKFGMAAMKLAGIDASDVKAVTDGIKAEIEAATMHYEGIAGFTAPDETPDEEVARKNRDRLDKPKEPGKMVVGTIELTSKTVIDGKNIAQSVSEHQVELAERAGAKISPWQRRAALVRQQNVPSSGAH